MHMETTGHSALGNVNNSLKESSVCKGTREVTVLCVRCVTHWQGHRSPSSNPTAKAPAKHSCSQSGVPMPPSNMVNFNVQVVRKTGRKQIILWKLKWFYESHLPPAKVHDTTSMGAQHSVSSSSMEVPGWPEASSSTGYTASVGNSSLRDTWVAQTQARITLQGNFIPLSTEPSCHRPKATTVVAPTKSDNATSQDRLAH